MASRKQLLEECTHALEAFLHPTSRSSFSIVKTVRSSTSAHAVQGPNATDPRTLFILDSSFNPPSRAHAALALSALRHSDLEKYPKPHRLLLLFSTHNADKKPAPAAFEHRLAMMVELARDVADELAARMSSRTSSKTATSSGQELGAEQTEASDELEVDIGVSDKPYYNEKSEVISSSTPPFYPSDPQHIHITGFDTILRIFNPKYYSATPPLSVLDPFFAKHGLRVTVREGYDEEGGIEGQFNWLKDNLISGKLDKDGGKSEWADKVEIVEAEKEGQGVSSTKIRKAVNEKNWEEVERLCTRRIVGWLREFDPYEEEEQ